MDKQAVYADKISKLLRKAESTNSQEEAETLFQKAQELMTRYAIDEAMLAESTGKPREEIVTETYAFTGIYRKPLFNLGHYVGLTNDCKVLVHDQNRSPQTRLCYLIGFESDVRNAKLLIQSLEIQALAEMKRWWSSEGKALGLEKADAKRARKEFIYAFATEIHSRLRAGRDEGIRQAKEESGDESVSLVLMSKKGRVDQWFDENHGPTRSANIGRRKAGHIIAHHAGRQAGSRADIGSKSVRGQNRLKGGE